MTSITLVFSGLLWAFALCIYAYFIFIGLAGFRKPKIIAEHKPSKKLACMIPAHNEENVIGDLIDSLQNQSYPKDLYRIFVVADNCSDDTARIGRKKGATVFERSGSGGKGEVIRYFLEKLFSEFYEEKFDAVCFFDADNIVHHEFLKRMNDALCEGKKCVQGYLGVKNPRDNWVTKAIYASYLVTNRTWQLSKQSLGLSASCGGTGFCVTSDILQNYGWPANTLTEDLEMEIFYALRGTRFFWLHDAITYDEKPCYLGIALKQRARWLSGHLNVFKKFFVELLVKGVKKRDIRLIDKALYLLYPVYLIAIALLTLIYGLSFVCSIEVFTVGYLETTALNIFRILIPLIGIYLETHSLKNVTLIVFMWIFAPIWMLASVLAAKDMNKKEWVHTPHGEQFLGSKTENGYVGLPI